MAKGTFAQQAARDDFSVRQERAVLVGVILEQGRIWDDPLAELADLVESAGALVVSRVIQKRKSYDPATCVGKGKVEEIRQRADAFEADVIVFDNDLSPSQIRELEKGTGRKVLDRSELILDIFATRAKTAEAHLQVELAQLQYTAPRLRGMWTHLERIAGAGGGTGVGSVGGIGTRGPGERQIEIDRRLVSRRIELLREKIAQVDKRKVREVTARKEFFTVCLVGYTNAGKSTLMNALTNAGTVARDRLFETLDTLTRKWSFGGGRAALLSDTVGFIRNLPHHLVASFRATLEGAIHADMLLHVADASSRELEPQIAAVNEVLASLGAADRPSMLVLNKVDAIDDEALLPVLRLKYANALFVSAKTGEGLDRVRDAVLDRMRGERQPITLSISVGNGKALTMLDRLGEVLETRYEDGRAIIDVLIAPRSIDYLHSQCADVRHLNQNTDEF